MRRTSKRKNLRRWLRSIPAVGGMALLGACHVASFENRSSKGPAIPESRPENSESIGTIESSDAQVEFLATETFILEQRPKIDFVWVVDNTGSMEPVIAKTQAHFKQFFASIEKRNDIRVAVVSAAEIGPNLNGIPTFPRARLVVEQALLDKGVVQVNAGVGNNNALAILSSALCPVATTDIGAVLSESPTDKICNVPRSAWTRYAQAESATKTPEWNEFTALFDSPGSKLNYVKLASGQLNAWYGLRPQARKILAVVSNDNVNGFGFSQFAEAQKSFPGQRGFDRFFAFVHTDKTCMPEKIDGLFGVLVPGTEKSPVALFGCTVPYDATGNCSAPDPTGKGGRSEVGTNYLASIRTSPSMPQTPTLLEGKAYSICKDDWASYFDDMTRVLVARDFQLKRKLLRIQAVSLGGRSINPSLIRVEGSRITVDESLLTDVEQTLTIEYAYALE